MAKEQKQLPASTEKPAEKKQLSLVEQMEGELKEITSANFYEVPARGGGKRMEPDAKALQYYANKAGGISTKVLDSGLDMTHAWAKVQAWLKNDPAMVKEDVVTIVFEMEFQSYVWDYFSKGCKRHANGCPVERDGSNKVKIVDGMPVLSDPIDVIELRKLLNRKMRFADRECITKAEGRLHKKLLSMEFRDPEEIESEAKDVALLSDNSSVRTAEATAPTAAAQPTQTAPAAKPAPTKAAEPAKPEPAKKAEPSQPAQASSVPKADLKAAPVDKEKLEQDRKAAVAAPEAKPGAPKKRSEIIADLASSIGCSTANILAYMAASLNTDVNGLAAKPKTDLDAIIVGLQECVKRFNAANTAAFIKKEPFSEGPHLAEEMAQFFLGIFAEEAKKGGK